MAILYLSGGMLLSPTDDSLGILTRDVFKTPRLIPRVLNVIEAFATAKPTGPMKDPLDRDIEAPEPELDLYNIDDLFMPSSMGLHGLAEGYTGDNSSNSQVEEEDEYRIEGLNTEDAAWQSGAASEKGSDTVESDRSDISDVEGLNDNHTKLSTTRTRSGKKRGVPAVCRGVLWAINTRGCIRGTFLLQFDEPQLNMSRLDISLRGGYPCCDRHTDVSDKMIPEMLRKLLPPAEGGISLVPSATVTEHTDHADISKDDGQSVRTVKQGNAIWAKKDAIFDVLSELHETVWRETACFGAFTPYTASALLPDDVILAIARRCDTITSPEDVDKVLTQSRHIGKSRPLPGIDSERIYITISPVITSLRTYSKRGTPRKAHFEYNALDWLTFEIGSNAPTEDHMHLAIQGAEVVHAHKTNEDRSESQGTLQ